MDVREVFTIDGRRFSNMAGFYDEVERVFTFGLDWKIGRNLNAFNDILRGGFGRHEYGQPIHIQWLAYDPSTSSGWPMKKASVISGKRLWTPLWKSSWIRTIPGTTVPWSGFDQAKKEASLWDLISTPEH